jgi:hypothetical protein
MAMDARRKMAGEEAADQDSGKAEEETQQLVTRIRNSGAMGEESSFQAQTPHLIA